jgi:hypothetical protein
MTVVPSIRIDDEVRVTGYMGDSTVRIGDVGVVCSILQAPAIAYEVEFRHPGAAFGLRTIVFGEQLALIESDRPDLAA